MIITAALNVIYGLLSVLLVFNLPQLPESILTLATTATGYMVSGLGILHTFIGNTAMGVIALCFQLVIAFNVAYFLYSFVVWVLKKVPFLGIE